MLDDVIFLCKFAAAWLLPPGIFLLALLYLVRRLWRAAKRRLAAFASSLALIMYLLSTPLVSSLLVKELEGAYPLPEAPAGDVIIMLGGGAFGDVPDFDGMGVLTSIPSSRLLTALRLHKRLGLPILLSGGQVYQASGNEAEIARRVLLSLGVSPDKIILENKSQTTGQNARFSAEILRAKGLLHPILVTSATHMERAVLNFAKNGIQVTAYPTDYLSGKGTAFHYNYLAPSAEALYDTTIVLRERLRTMVTKYIE